MRHVWILYQQELKNAFRSFLAYVLPGVFMAITSYFFVSLITSFSMLSQQWKSTPGAPEVNFNLTEMVLAGLYVNVACVLLFFTPLLTMRTFSEEKKSGTLELLLTLPLKDHEVVLGKFFSALTLYLVIILTLFLYPILIQSAGGYFEWGTVFTGFLGLVLLGACFIASGMFISSLTENQVISAVLSFGVFIILWMIGWLGELSEARAISWVAQFSFLEHYKSLAKGILDLRDIAFYIFFAIFFVYATLLSLEARALKR